MSRPLPARPALDPGVWLSSVPVTVTVTGCSMEPFLREGDRVDLVAAEPSSLEPGAVVAFRREDGVVVHRLLALRSGRFLEKGDAQDRGVWRPWPEAMGLAVAARRGDGSEELSSPDARARQRRNALGELRRHRLHAVAARLPGGLVRRVFLRALRPLLRP